MASYHLNVTPISRATGRSATACAAYRAAERIDCEREGRCHDYTRKSGVEHREIVLPDHAPDWAQDRSRLWNAAEAAENRCNSVVAREWRIALPAELSPEDRRELAMDFAHALVERFGVAADVAIHAPHRDGDERNYHAHVMTTTRRLGPEGFTEKTRELDNRATGSEHISEMRASWAERQNDALERAGCEDRVDHRSLAAQREEAEAERDRLAEELRDGPDRAEDDTAARLAELERAHADAVLRAEALDREPEAKLGPAVNAIERKEQREAERDGRDYQPVTDRGAQVHLTRQARSMFDDMRERLNRARETYTHEREQGSDRIRAGLEAIRAAASRDRGSASPESITERLNGILERAREGPENRDPEGRSIEERLKAITGRDREPEPAPTREPPCEEGRAVDSPLSEDDLDRRALDLHQQTLDRMYEGLDGIADPARRAAAERVIERLEEAGQRFRQESGLDRERDDHDRDDRPSEEPERFDLSNGPVSADTLRDHIRRDAERIAARREQEREELDRDDDRGMDIDFD